MATKNAIINTIIMTAPNNANGNQNGNHTQNHVKVAGRTLVSFKIKNTNQVIQHNVPNGIVALDETVTFCCVLTSSPPISCRLDIYH